MKLVLPYPPTANLYWRVFRGRAVKSKAARTYQAAVGLLAKTSCGRPLAGPLSVQIDVWRPWKRGDLDNTLKVLLDALRGIAFEDDDQVVRLQANRFDDKHNPRAEVTITPCE